MVSHGKCSGSHQVNTLVPWFSAFMSMTRLFIPWNPIQEISLVCSLTRANIWVTRSSTGQHQQARQSPLSGICTHFNLFYLKLFFLWIPTREVSRTLNLRPQHVTVQRLLKSLIRLNGIIPLERGTVEWPTWNRQPSRAFHPLIMKSTTVLMGS